MHRCFLCSHNVACFLKFLCDSRRHTSLPLLGSRPRSLPHHMWFLYIRPLMTPAIVRAWTWFFFEPRWRIYALGASSPFFISHESRDNAYIHSKRQRSVSPNPQSSFRLPGSPLKRSITDKSPATAGSEHLTQATGNLHVDEALLVSKVLIWSFCGQLITILNV